MRKIIITAVIFFIIVPPSFADFKLAVISDTQDNDEDGINNGVLSVIMDRIKSENVDFILVAGDMVNGSTRTSEHIKQLRKWKVLMDSYKIPVYCVPSNHVIQSEMSENIFRSVFEMPENGPDGFKELVYSFDYKGAHFVGIDTEEYNNFHDIGEEQFNWLRQDLEQNEKRIVFVFGHDPAYPVSHHKFNSLDRVSSKRDDIWSLFKNCDVEVYFCGHEHLYNKSLHEGVYQIIAGGGGGGLVESPEKGGFHHFVVVNVKDNGTCEVTTIDIDGAVKDSFVIN